MNKQGMPYYKPFNFLYRSGGSQFPFPNDLLVQSCPIKVEDGRIIDSSGKGDRLSVPSKVFNGDGTWYIRFADYPSTAVDYYDVGLDSIVSTTTDVNGDLLFANGTKVSYILIDGHTFTPESISDPTSANQTTFASTNGEVQAQAYLTSDTWVVDSLDGVADCDTYGCVLADGLTMYKDEALTLPYEDGQPTVDGQAWVSDGEGGAEHYTLVGDEKGRIKHNGRIIDGDVDSQLSNKWDTVSLPVIIGEKTFEFKGGEATTQQIVKSLNGIFSDGETVTLAFDVLETSLSTMGVFFISSSSIVGAGVNLTNESRTVGRKYFTFDCASPIVSDQMRFVYTSSAMIGIGVKIANIAMYRGTINASNEPTNERPVNGNSIIFTDKADNPYTLPAQNEYINDIDYFFDITDAENYSARVVAIADMVNIVNNQYYFVFDDDGNLTCVLMYDEPKTGEDRIKILKKLKLIETAVDSEGETAVDSEGEIAYAPIKELNEL